MTDDTVVVLGIVVLLLLWEQQKQPVVTTDWTWNPLPGTPASMLPAATNGGDGPAAGGGRIPDYMTDQDVYDFWIGSRQE